MKLYFELFGKTILGRETISFGLYEKYDLARSKASELVKNRIIEKEVWTIRRVWMD